MAHITYSPCEPSRTDANVSHLWLTRTLRVTADDLDSIGVNLVRVVELEVDVLDDEGPNIVTEAVGIEVALQTQRISLRALSCHNEPCSP